MESVDICCFVLAGELDAGWLKKLSSSAVLLDALMLPLCGLWESADTLLPVEERGFDGALMKFENKSVSCFTGSEDVPLLNGASNAKLKQRGEIWQDYWAVQ